MNKMEESLIIENEIDIEAPAARVWDALTNPEQTRKYMFGCAVVSGFKEGDPMLWQGEVDGRLITFVQGHVVRCDPERELVYSTFDPNSDVPDIPENYLTVTYRLTEEEGKTTLYISQGDYSRVHDGQARYSHAEEAGGWLGLMMLIKELVETEQ